MKKLGKIGLQLLFFVVVFGAGFWWSFPRQEAVDYGVVLMTRAAAHRGVKLTVRGATMGEGLVPHWRVEDIEGRSPLFSVRGTAVEARWLPLDSLISGSLALSLTWGNGGLDAFGKHLAWDGGEAHMEMTPGILRCAGLDLRGSVQARGDLTVDLAGARIRTAQMRISVPGDLDPVLGGAAMFLPLQKESEGLWHLTREDDHGTPQS